jgi:hypothetical protein
VNPQAIKSIADAGAKVVVTGSTLGDLALHFCNKYSVCIVMRDLGGTGGGGWDGMGGALCSFMRETMGSAVVYGLDCPVRLRGGAIPLGRRSKPAAPLA